jgi:hypothetical protein
MIKINLEKAKETAHGLMREARAREFAPWDEIISKQIPGESLTSAEEERQRIREKYDEIQKRIDLAETPEELTEIAQNMERG